MRSLAFCSMVFALWAVGCADTTQDLKDSDMSSSRIGESQKADVGTEQEVGTGPWYDSRLAAENDIGPITGFWDINFPATSGSNGYFFHDKGFFLFFNYQDLNNIENRYDGSLGYWRVREDVIEILVSVNFYWKDAYVPLPFGGFMVEDTNVLEKVEVRGEWKGIGTTDSLVPSEEERPEYLSLSAISNSAIKSTQSYFFKMLSLNDVDLEWNELSSLETTQFYSTVLDSILSPRL